MVDLFRVRDFTIQELAVDLPRAVDETRDVLLSRYHPGTVRRLGGSDAEVRKYIQKLLIRDRQDELVESGRATYAVTPRESRPDGAQVVGLATLSRHVKSQHARLQVPTGITDLVPFASRLISPDVPLGQINGTGWTMHEYDDRLSDVYSALRQETEGHQLWTIEPVRSGARFHEAILAAGLTAIGPTLRYDVGEDGHYIPPVSQAYVYDGRL